MGGDIVIKNCKAVTYKGIKEMGIAIDDGKIVALGEDVFLPEANRTMHERQKAVF